MEKALEEKDSLFYTYKKLIQLRHEHPIVVWGTYNLIDTEDDNIFAYCRVLDEQKWLIITNFQEKTTTFDLKEEPKSVLIQNYTKKKYTKGMLYLDPYEAVVLEIS